MRLGGGTEKKLVANMGGARGELISLETLFGHSCFECHDRDEADETYIGHVDLNIEAIEAEQETGPE